MHARVPCSQDKKAVAVTRPEDSPWFEVDLGVETQARRRGLGNPKP